MPRKVRVTENEHQCRVCPNVFVAKRTDARYCSPKCRQAISRATRAQADSSQSMASLKNDARVECSACGCGRDGRTRKCQICGSTQTRKVKK